MLDIRDLWRGGLTLRRVKVLLDKLPDDSRTWSEIRDDLTPEQIEQQRTAMGGERKHGRWSRTDMLLALIKDEVAKGNYEQLLIATDKKDHKKFKAPKPVPRPGVDEEKDLPPATESQRAFLERLASNRGAYIPQED